MRVIFMLFKILCGILLALFNCFVIVLVIAIAGPFVQKQFKIDLSQSYRGVEDYRQILFYDSDGFYRRHTWGLQKVYTDTDYLLPNSGGFAWYGEGGDRVYAWGDDNGIQCLDLRDSSVEEVLSREDAERTGTINADTGYSEADYCRDWNNGSGFTYQISYTNMNIQPGRSAA